MSRFVWLALLAVMAVACTSANSGGGYSDDPDDMPAFLRQEVEDRIEALAWQSDAELYQNIMRLAYIGDTALPLLVEALENESARTRGSCAYVLGLIRDRRAIQPLRLLLDDPVVEVRYEAGTALCQLGDPEGYTALVEGLEDERIRNRYKAHQALRMLTKLDFGYHHDDSAEERKLAVYRWQEWLTQMLDSPL